MSQVFKVQSIKDRINETFLSFRSRPAILDNLHIGFWKIPIYAKNNWALLLTVIGSGNRALIYANLIGETDDSNILRRPHNNANP